MFSPDPADGSMTGQVGTALYTAPELSSVTKTVYNQKVDVYSLGNSPARPRPSRTPDLIRTAALQESSCSRCATCRSTPRWSAWRSWPASGPRRSRSPPTSTTRPTANRRPSSSNPTLTHTSAYFEVTFPRSRWLLNHSVSQRPTSQELLQSDLIPPPVLEEEKLREMFRHTLSNPQMKAYKYLVASCFRQPVTPAQDITYDMSLPAPSSATRSLQNFNFVRETVAKVIESHCFFFWFLGASVPGGFRCLVCTGVRTCRRRCWCRKASITGGRSRACDSWPIPEAS